MKRSVLFSIAGVIAVLCAMAAVYFLIPGIYHPYLALRGGQLGFIDPNKHPSVVKSAHRIYAAVCLGSAFIFAVAAYLSRPKKVKAI